MLRTGILVTAAILAFVGVWAHAEDRETLSLEPFASLYELQQGKDMDLGFLAGEAHPGFGGSATGVDITYSDGALRLECRGGAYEILSASGLVTSAKLFCPTRDLSYDTVTDALAEAGYTQVKDFMHEARRPEEWGRSVADAYAALPGEEGNKIARIPLSRWENESDTAVSLSAASYKPAGADYDMVELQISVKTSCLFALSVFSKIPAGDAELHSDLVAPVFAAFKERAWDEVPVAERYAMARQVALALCRPER